MDTKSFLTSKTLWVNSIAFAAGLLQLRYGWVISPEYQAMALAGVNALLRLITKQPVAWQ